MNKEIIKEKEVIDQFLCGYDCGQVVLSYFSKELKIDEDIALKVSSGLGAGMFCGNTCGAVIGAIIVLGIKYGHIKKNDIIAKEKIKNITQKFIKLFIDKYGSIECKQLLKYDISKKEDFDKILEKNLLFTFCPKLVLSSVTFLQ